MGARCQNIFKLVFGGIGQGQKYDFWGPNGFNTFLNTISRLPWTKQKF
jgi:hypothetical protein